ncbi:hypothetical protein roselon_00149 [Roseibacterium elongatum DSM 19469]|uniref:Uncharacterized protein n=2 Tax=Roseicyclus elongatus TaxID=159346 RepID=W8S1J8_9RHOB|nr:hypothetical protein roselon_00149 [Roseibacterium elongatum DSM 19469]
MMPWSVPIMAMLATSPPAWRRVMDRRAQRVMQAAELRLTAGRAHPGGGPANGPSLRA